MPQITLNRQQLDQFAAFLRKHDCDKWFIAKDEGAYIGATAADESGKVTDRCIFYFRGCDPKKDEDYWDTQQSMFGGDDFGEYLEAEIVLGLADNPDVVTMRVKLSASKIQVDYSVNKPKVAAPKPSLRPTNKMPKSKKSPKPDQAKAKKRTIGAVAMDAIRSGKSNEQVLEAVRAEFPSAKTTVACVNWYRNKVRKG